MGCLNRVTIIGYVGNDAELKYTPGGTAVANFNVATTEVWKHKDGEKQEHTEWHRIVAWGKLGEVCGEYLKKGRQVYVEGRIRTRTYEDREKIERTVVEIVADNVMMLGKNGTEAAHVDGSDGQPPKDSEDA